MEPLELDLVQVCRTCGGKGLRWGGTRSERDCEACDGAGELPLRVRLDDKAVQALAYRIEVIQSEEYAEYQQREQQRQAGA